MAVKKSGKKVPNKAQSKGGDPSKEAPDLVELTDRDMMAAMLASQANTMRLVVDLSKLTRELNDTVSSLEYRLKTPFIVRMWHRIKGRNR